MAIFEDYPFDSTAFMSGQMRSKLWLTEALSVAVGKKPQRIYVLAGWYCLTNLLLRTRYPEITVEWVKTFDIDPNAYKGALVLNEAWECVGEFSSHLTDVNTLSYDDSPTLVINTSVEHMESRKWWDDIPKGTRVALQSNDMQHDQHVDNISSLEEFISLYPFETLEMADELRFDYETWGFIRFMLIGIK